MFTRVKTPIEIEAIRESGRMLAAVLDELERMLTPGVSERELAEKAARELKALGGKPAFKGYQGFPDVICISTNEEIVHGIPTDYIFQEGDITGLDFGVIYRGMVTDGARTLAVGRVNAEAAKLINVTRAALDVGIAACHDGVQTGDIGAAIQGSLAMHPYGIVRELVGHGVGHAVHEEPDVPNYGIAGQGSRLQAGMTIAIEPMLTLGSERIIIDKQDGWTVRTADGSLSAHFEHTVLITEGGAEILTISRA